MPASTASTSTRPSTGRRSRSSPPQDIPGDNIVSLISDDQPVLVPIGGEIQHHAEPLVLLAAADRETLRRARHGVTVRSTPLAPVFDPLESEHVFAHYEINAGDLDAGFAEADLVLEGDLPGRPPGAALHREQRDDRGAARGRRRGRPRQSPVPVLHPQGAEAVPRADQRAGPGGPGRDRRRVRRQGGVPLDRRAPRRAPRAEGRQAGPDDLRPARGPARDHQAPPRGRPPPDRASSSTARSSPRTSRSSWTAARTARSRRSSSAAAPSTRAGRTAARTSGSGRERRERTPRRTGRSAASAPPRPSSRPRSRWAGSAKRSGIGPLEIRRRNLYRIGDETPTGQILSESVAAEEVLERAAEAAEFEGVAARTAKARARRAGSGHVPGSPLRTTRDRTASGIGVALAFHGAGFTGSGEVKLARSPRSSSPPTAGSGS